MESLGSYLKGFLFFVGSTLQWPVRKSKEFLFLHGYILLIYFLAFVAKLASFDAVGLIYTIGALGPLMLAIYRGLPLDCLDYEAAISREIQANKLEA